jgi:2-oxoglutarate dehydrogenase E2 component (dihydrolipoamide succinyltransferase)
MPTDVVMPQMGESIAEGTIVRWIKQVGDAVERDEPLFEISTDKVDAEIPSPVAGVLSEIRAREGQTVPVNSVVAVISPAGEATSAPAKPASAAAAAKEPPRQDAAPSQDTAPAAAPPPPAAPQPQADGAPARSAAPVKDQSAAVPAAPADTTTESAIRQRSSPLVRKIAKEHDIDITQIQGSGIGGRVTKDDILAFIDGGPSAARPTAAPARSEAPSPRPQPDAAAAAAPASPSTAPGRGAPTPGTTVPMSVMRKKIAEHMMISRRTSAHVHSVFEVSFARVAQVRAAKKAEYERAGVKLTYMSFIIKAVVDALQAVPVMNSSVQGDSIVYHKDVNVGVAVALDRGLIVPVIKHADEKNLLGLSRTLADLAARARAKQLKPDEVAGGTFTITNPGVFGALFGMPIINQPQVGILGVGNVEKRPVVIDDAIAIRQMAYLSIGYDHRIIDGAVADEFMSHVKKTLETWDASRP